MLYMVYNTNDHSLNEGEVIQANKIWHPTDADKAHEDGMHDLGQIFIKVESPHVLSPLGYYIDVTAKELMERPVMQIDVSKTHIKAGADDCVLLTRCPSGAKFSVRAGDLEYESGQLDPDGTEISLSVPVPCTCKIMIDKWPYQSFTATVEVHA
jgi:hypothetical protein